MLLDFYYSLTHEHFTPLLLFLSLRSVIPSLRMHFDLPKILSRSPTFSLRVAIGRRGGEEPVAYAGTFQQPTMRRLTRFVLCEA